jgi:hypothetical protein
VISGLRVGVLSVAILGASFHSGCSGEKPTHVAVSGGTTPTFALSGDGNLGTFSIYLVPPSPEKMTAPIFDQTPVWKIVAKPDFLHGRPIEAIGELTYGVVPDGYNQISQPQPIIPDRTYFFNCETTDAPTAAGFFRVEDGKTVPAQGSLPCLEMRNGKWVTTPCVQKNQGG